MLSRHTMAWLALTAAGELLVSLPSGAVIFDATGDPSHNTTAPGGALESSGWQYEGRFGAFLGTAIAPHYFLTAKHVGGDTNTPFVFAESNYYPVAHYDVSDHCDLRLWRVSGRLPRYAPVYAGTNEIGAPLIVFGRGTQRGAQLVTGDTTNGWLWGTADSVMRWGSNTVADIVTSDEAPYLYATFDHCAGPDECHVSRGDSGGAAFVLADGAWQLAGIHCAVDSDFNTTNQEAGCFNAAIYDAHGLYRGSGTDWTLVTNHVASGFYSSRVSAHYDWLVGTIPDFDGDADGIPDWWERRYSGGGRLMTSTNDPDGDGFDNLAEWVAGTDPTNAASFLTIDAVRPTHDGDTIVFNGLTNRRYRVWRLDTALQTTNAWVLASTNTLPGRGDPTYWSTTITTLPAPRFYRLEVSLPDDLP